MPFPGRSLLLVCAAVAGAALGAGPAVGARHHRARLIATKAHAHGHVPAAPARRPPLVGTLPVTDPGAPTAPTTTGPVPTTPAPSCPRAIGVTEDEYHTRPSRTTACPATIVIELSNTGQDDHDLEIVDLDTGAVVATWDKLHPGGKASQHVALAAGTYRLFCTLSDDGGPHDAQGMHAVITVG